MRLSLLAFATVSSLAALSFAVPPASAAPCNGQQTECCEVEGSFGSVLCYGEEWCTSDGVCAVPVCVVEVGNVRGPCLRPSPDGGSCLIYIRQGYVCS